MEEELEQMKFKAAVKRQLHMKSLEDLQCMAKSNSTNIGELISIIAETCYL